MRTTARSISSAKMHTRCVGRIPAAPAGQLSLRCTGLPCRDSLPASRQAQVGHAARWQQQHPTRCATTLRPTAVRASACMSRIMSAPAAIADRATVHYPCLKNSYRVDTAVDAGGVANLLFRIPSPSPRSPIPFPIRIPSLIPVATESHALWIWFRPPRGVEPCGYARALRRIDLLK